jgi:predicted Zn-dependent protease
VRVEFFYLTRLSRVIITLSIFAISLGCSTVPEDTNPVKAALLAEPPREYVEQVERAFRKRVAFIDDREIDAYLTKLTTKLFSPGKSEIHVSLVSTTNAGYDPSVWVIPGGKIFFDIRILRTLHFENEIVSALAFAWERAEGIGFRERLINEAQHANIDPAKIWEFTLLENEQAIESAVDRIYKAGYDPRGLVNYFNHAPSRSKNQIESETESLKQKARRAVAFYAPLLNPVVRTEDFYKMRKRLGQL